MAKNGDLVPSRLGTFGRGNPARERVRVITALGHHGRSLTSDPKVMTYVATGRSHVFFTPAFDSQKRRIGLKFR